MKPLVQIGSITFSSQAVCLIGEHGPVGFLNTGPAQMSGDLYWPDGMESRFDIPLTDEEEAQLQTVLERIKTRVRQRYQGE